MKMNQNSRASRICFPVPTLVETYLFYVAVYSLGYTQSSWPPKLEE
jgi:hypothetical protein